MDHYIRLLHTNQCPTIDDAHIYVRNVMQLGAALFASCWVVWLAYQ